MGFFDKLKNGLFKTKSAIVDKIENVFKSFAKVDEDLFEELEELLISADVGVSCTEKILDNLRESVIDKKIKEPELVKDELFDRVANFDIHNLLKLWKLFIDKLSAFGVFKVCKCGFYKVLWNNADIYVCRENNIFISAPFKKS